MVGWVDVLEAVNAPAADDRAWAGRVIEATLPIFETLGSTDKVALLCVKHASDCSTCEIVLKHSTGAWERSQRNLVGQHEDMVRRGPAVFKALYYPGAIVTKQSALIAKLPREAAAAMGSHVDGYGIHDVLGVLVHPEPGMAFVLCAGYAKPFSIPRNTRTLLSQVGLHIEASFRLRKRPEHVRAVLNPDGKILHHDRDAPARDVLVERTRRIERARTRRGRASPNALELWQALVDGTASLVERTDGGKRLYFVLENAPARQPFRSLTKDEVDTVSYAARGLSAKLVAYALGVAESTVSARLGTAASKIGLASRIELVRIAAMLTNDPRARFEDIALTTVERDVLELLAQGLSNAEIAKIRNRSVRTIANQVSALLAKTCSATRRALVTRVTAR